MVVRARSLHLLPVDTLSHCLLPVEVIKLFILPSPPLTLTNQCIPITYMYLYVAQGHHHLIDQIEIFVLCPPLHMPLLPTPPYDHAPHLIGTPIINTLIITVAPDPIGVGCQEVVDLSPAPLDIPGGPAVSGMNGIPLRGG